MDRHDCEFVSEWAAAGKAALGQSAADNPHQQLLHGSHAGAPAMYGTTVQPPPVSDPAACGYYGMPAYPPCSAPASWIGRAIFYDTGALASIAETPAEKY